MRAPSRLLSIVLAAMVAGCGSVTPTPVPAVSGTPSASTAPGATTTPGATTAPGASPTPGATASTPALPASISVGQVPGPRWGAQAARLADGRVILIGGATDINMPSANASGAAALFDPTTGTWKATAPAPAGRFDPYVFPGPGGTAIVMGFDDMQTGKPKLAPLIYDPVKDAWRRGATWTPSTFQLVVAMTQLLDGSVLAIGADHSMRYDPKLDTWSAVDPAPTAMSGMRAATLTDGRVLAIGGEDANNKPTNIARLFDPATGHWSPAAKMPAIWRGPLLVPLPDGGALALGGPGYGFGMTGSTRYDAKTNAWGPVVPLAVGRQEPVVTPLADGRVLAIGGSVSTVSCAVVAGGEVYDPATGAWSAVTGLATARDAAIGTLLADGRVLISLGAASATKAVNRNVCELHRFLNDAEVLDPAKLAPVTLPTVAPPTATAAGLGTFAAAAGPVVTGAVVVALGDKGALVLGGSSPVPVAQGGYLVPSAAVWRFGPDGAMSKAAPMVSSRSAPAALRLTDGTVLVVGPDGSGFKQGKTAGPMAERFDPVAGTWHAVADPGEHVGAALAALPSGGAILIGGTVDTSDKPYAIDATTLLFDAATEKWSPGPPMPAGVLDPAVASLTDGRVVVAGGIGMDGPVASVFLYDPVAATWSRAADLPAARARAASLVLADGSLVLVGGYGSQSQLADAVVFSPTTGAWTTTASFGPAREAIALAALSDGRVLMAGGLAADGTDAALATTLVLDPASGAWTLGRSLSTPRTGAAVLQLATGIQLVGGIGGVGGGSSASSSGKPLSTRDVLGAP